MNHAKVVRAVLAFTILALSVFYVLTEPPRLGLDLRGGTQIVLETRDSATVKADRESTEQTLEVLRRRVDALGVTEPTITQSGERRIIVELPGVQDPRQAAAVLGRTAQLTFHPVLGFSEPPAPGPGTIHGKPGQPPREAGAGGRRGPATAPRPGRADRRGRARRGGPDRSCRAPAAGSSPWTSAAQASGPGRS